MRTVIMAGGAGCRLSGDEEKPLLRIGDETLLERSVRAAVNSKAGTPLIATSDHTPKTTRFAREHRWEVIWTPGKGYHGDTLYLLGSLGDYISINVDVPFMTSEAIDEMHSAIRDSSIACVVSRDRIRFPVSDKSLMHAADGTLYIWVGLNYVTPDPDTELLVMDDELLAVNVNTPEDLALVRDLICTGAAPR